MREYFTIMIKEGDTSNLKLLTEKLNEGFEINDRFEVGRSALITLRRIPQLTSRVNYVREMAEAVPTGLTSMYASDSIPF